MSHLDELIIDVTKLLKKKALPYVFRELSLAEVTVHAPIKVLNQVVQFREFISISERDIQCFGVMPFSVKEDQRALASEYLMRVNWYLQSGWFSMDYNDGEVRARVERSHINSRPDEEDLSVLIMTPISMIANYMSGLILTIQGHGTPKENAEKYTPDALKS